MAREGGRGRRARCAGGARRNDGERSWWTTTLGYALELFEKAAAKGHSGAMFGLGALHSGGHNLPVDRSTAQRWFRAAAELGHGPAQLMLGRYLVAGAADELNRAEGELWLQRAAAQGIAEAESELAHLRTSKSPGVA